MDSITCYLGCTRRGLSQKGAPCMPIPKHTCTFCLPDTSPPPPLWSELPPPGQHKGWMESGQEPVFCWVPVSQLTWWVSCVAFVCYPSTNNVLAGCQFVTSENSHYLCIKPSIHLFSYLSSQTQDLLLTKMSYKGKIINSVEVHPKLSHHGHQMDGALVGCWFTLAHTCDCAPQTTTSCKDSCRYKLFKFPPDILWA